MKEKERMAKALKFFEGLETLMSNLYGRWQDEKKYEDIQDYAGAIQSQVEAIGGIFVKMTKRPFGFIYTLDIATYKVMVRKANYEYKRIA